MRLPFAAPSTVALRKPWIGAVALLCAATVPIWLYLQLFRDALIDDTFITLQYVRTLRDTGAWGFYPWETTNTATSPLNVILTAATSVVVRDIVQAALALATLEALALLVLLLLISRHIRGDYLFGALSFLAVMGNPLLISTLGLEPLLYITLLMACMYAFLQRRYAMLAIAAALLTLTRPDGGLIVPVTLVALLLTERAAGRAVLLHHVLRFMGLYALCLLPWALYAWINLGSLVPVTLLIKRGQGNWEGYNFFNGVAFYIKRFPREVPLALFLAPFAALCIRRKPSRAALFAALLFCFSAIYFAAYTLLGVPPYHWYFVPAVVPWTILGILGLLTYAEQRGAAQHPVIRRAWYALPSVAAVIGLMLFFKDHHLPLIESPIHTNWATHSRYQEIGLYLRDNVEPDAYIQLGGEIGTVAFYSERRLVDAFSCRVTSRDIRRKVTNMRGISRAIARANFRWLRDDTACGPIRYELAMYNFPASVVEFPPKLLKQWVISTAWVASGRVALARR